MSGNVWEWCSDRILNSTKMKSGNTIAAQPSQLPLNPATYMNMNNAG